MKINKNDLDNIIREARRRIDGNENAILDILEMTDGLTAEEKYARADYEYRNMVCDIMQGVYAVLCLMDNWQTIRNNWLEEIEAKYNIYDYEV